MSGGVMTLTMDDEVGIALVEASPEAGSTLDLGAGAQISLLFNKSILVTDGAILYGDGKSAALNVYASGKSATSELRTVLYSLLSNSRKWVRSDELNQLFTFKFTKGGTVR
jgi:hypothetical protein